MIQAVECAHCNRKCTDMGNLQWHYANKHNMSIVRSLSNIPLKPSKQIYIINSNSFLTIEIESWKTPVSITGRIGLTLVFSGEHESLRISVQNSKETKVVELNSENEFLVDVITVHEGITDNVTIVM